MRSLAIIPARGGSKRIPRKNIREFRGKPILAYPIETALASGLFSEVMVSSDDPEILAAGKRFGAETPFTRSSRNSSDTATTAEVLVEVLDEYRRLGKTFDAICCIYPTSVFVTPDLLKEAKDWIDSGGDAAITVAPFSTPIERALIVQNERLVWTQPEMALARTQDLPMKYHDAGQLYFVRTEAFLAERALFVRNSVPLIRSELEIQDIDSECDWTLAELKFDLLRKLGRI